MEVCEMIVREMQRNHMSQAVLAKKLNNNHTAVHTLMTRKSIQVPKLLKLCEIFQYNFFREIAQSLPYKEPDYYEADINAVRVPLEETIKDLEDQVKNLKLEVNILRQTIKDLVSRQG
jgi:hypothetical protein